MFVGGGQAALDRRRIVGNGQGLSAHEKTSQFRAFGRRHFQQIVRRSHRAHFRVGYASHGYRSSSQSIHRDRLASENERRRSERAYFILLKDGSGALGSFTSAARGTSSFSRSRRTRGVAENAAARSAQPSQRARSNLLTSQHVAGDV